MKKLIYITGIIIILAACGHKLQGIGEISSIDNVSDEIVVSNYDASQAANKKTKDPNKHSSCGHYQKEIRITHKRNTNNDQVSFSP